MADIEKLIDVFMHMGDHIRNLDEYGLCYDSTLAEAIEDVVEMLKNEEIRENPRKSEWIPATERLPEKWQETNEAWFGEYIEFIVLIAGAAWATTLCFDGTNFFDMTTGAIYDVSHWMPLPEPPKERNDG